MKIACIDITAAGRDRLLAQLRAWLIAERQVIGHISRFEFFAMAPETINFSERIDVAVMGSGVGPEHAARLAEKISLRDDVTAIFVFLRSEDFSFANLQLFSQGSAEIFNDDNDRLRFLARLCATRVKNRADVRGRLCTFFAAKGGVGLTTIVTALAHAAQDRGQTALVLDLSRNSDIANSLALGKKFSTEFSSLLQQRCQLSLSDMASCIKTAENGINLILPPAGGAEVRESWIRASETLPTTMSLIEVALEQFDYVFVDTAQSEGILPFSLSVRSDERVMVSSNEVDSIYFATQKSSFGAGYLPGGEISLLINCRSLFGLTAAECMRYVRNVTDGAIEWKELPAIPCDRSGSFWIGSRNSFFTESNKATRTALGKLLRHLAGEPESATQSCDHSTPLGLLLRRMRQLTRGQRRITGRSLLMLPHLPQRQPLVASEENETGDSSLPITAEIKEKFEISRGPEPDDLLPVELLPEDLLDNPATGLTVTSEQYPKEVDLLLRPEDLLLGLVAVAGDQSQINRYR
ncbi:MAG: AAA family ATPase [bacterium]|nr:AAA family ATPase [bacterium]